MTEIKVEYLRNFETRCIHVDSHSEIKTDAPKEVGGGGSCFSPGDLFAASLGSCVMTLMAMRAKKLNVDLSGSTVKVLKEMSSTPPRRVAKMTLEVLVPHSFSLSIQEELIKAAKTCPIHESLHPDIAVVFNFRWGS